MFLKIEYPRGIAFERCSENQKESVIVAIPTEVMDRIAGSWIEKRKSDAAAWVSEADMGASPIEAEESVLEGCAATGLIEAPAAKESAEMQMRYIQRVPKSYLVRKVVRGKVKQRFFPAVFQKHVHFDDMPYPQIYRMPPVPTPLGAVDSSFEDHPFANLKKSRAPNADRQLLRPRSGLRAPVGASNAEFAELANPRQRCDPSNSADKPKAGKGHVLHGERGRRAVQGQCIDDLALAKEG
ncbi:hypothetical protein HG264_01105 [Pseudomonas sp. gcc21]|uniref:hypothetical protein n=1 Tax=Pseudomonas sp. gcc21 TaxID=2726989 RepID=UPI00145209FD|nr:hypothetical protein [Pseudomonas sp. gcc21]QJD57602.1 hypothetical protein HG264_01105 [Pseudomonas sp. gcc21]